MLFANLTVRETFEFAVNIRLPASVSKDTKRQVRGAVDVALAAALPDPTGTSWRAAWLVLVLVLVLVLAPLMLAAG